MGTQWPTLIHALVRRHSEKPEVFREMIDCYFPTLPKFELHARGHIVRPGWEVWGPEAPVHKDTRIIPAARHQGELEDRGKRGEVDHPVRHTRVDRKEAHFGRTKEATERRFPRTAPTACAGLVEGLGRELHADLASKLNPP
jgi:hypothetical protein